MMLCLATVPFARTEHNSNIVVFASRALERSLGSKQPAACDGDNKSSVAERIVSEGFEEKRLDNA